MSRGLCKVYFSVVIKDIYVEVQVTLSKDEKHR